MLFIRINSIDIVKFEELQNESLTAAFTLLPIEHVKEITRPLYNPSDYSNDIINFPISDNKYFKLKIELSAKSDEVDYDKFCSAVIDLKSIEIERYYHFKVKTQSKIIEKPPILELSLGFTKYNENPFFLLRCQFATDFNFDEKEDESLTKDELFTMQWCASVDEKYWSLMFRKGFMERLIKEVKRYKKSNINAQEIEISSKKKIDRLDKKRITKDSVPIMPPIPIEE